MAPHSTHDQPGIARAVPQEPIAIIGSGCRFPGDSSSPSKLWSLLKQPRDLRTKIPPSRFDPEGFYHPDNSHHGTSNVRHSYLLSEDHRHFDAQFFGIKPAEANAIDPQQRLLLETVYESLESAGLKIEDLQGSQTAVYVGLMCGDYADLLVKDPDSFPTYLSTGTARSIMSNRVSYFFDWHGPCMTIDTACSSSLVAVHQAVQTLRSGQSPVAITAGSNLCLGPEPYIAESKLKMLSPNGRSRMWDAQADGYARGDGVAAVVLKTLSKALEDGDQIECLIVETGVNQDGRTKGITMPSATAQAALIRDTYRRAGLDPRRTSDRCQYFEAHGTGTPAGDPIEAQAIASTFFDIDADVTDLQDPLYVGSIKTVLGHTEGTAGLAALFKASLALQNLTIPPNMLFENLNPKIRQFYDHLEVPTQARPWPILPAGVPPRASVNSFGFGGTNAHAILQRYDTSVSKAHLPRATVSLTPVLFSAASEYSLISNLFAYSTYLKNKPSASLRDFSHTLNSRRSNLPIVAAFAGATTEALSANILTKLEEAENSKDITVGSRAQTQLPSKPKVLGVFSGQGAQWAGMGRELILGSTVVQTIIRKLEMRLAQLPKSDRPSWSLEAELLAGEDSSRLKEAELSQPLCTAIQIVLVDLLNAAEIRFDAVVGHSSGEISAAYACGLISAEDAICIAYYRGFHSKLAHGLNGEKGAMLAVGTSLEDAVELCNEPELRGRVTVAAHNSSASVTLSGDAEAITQLKEVLDDENKFARLLVVDKAYHSHHMNACSDAYIASLKSCDIQIRQRKHVKCSWFSSVFDEEITNAKETLRDVYWNDNMVNPVLFAQAIERATADKGPFDLALEVGPHPALKGPATQVIQDLLETTIPYSGLLSRGKNDVEAFASGLAFVRLQLGTSSVNFEGLDAMTSSGTKPQILKDLPSYNWEHGRIFWNESRVSKLTRTRHTPVHQLLGTRCPDGPDQQFRWRNFLTPSEIPWLSGHQIQGQMVFPGAGYVSTAVEAARALDPAASIKLIELYDLEIKQALTFESTEARVETNFTITDVTHANHDTFLGSFSFFSAPGKDPTNMILNCSGRLRVVYGAAADDILPSKPPPEIEMIDVPEERFYSSLNDLGYGYTGPFRALSSMKRKLRRASGLVAKPAVADHGLIIHPAMLDAAIQSVMLAKSWPGDGRLWTLHVPSTIDRISINPSICLRDVDQDFASFETSLHENVEAGICGDVTIYSVNCPSALIQMEGMRAVPLESADPSKDRKLFSTTIWNPNVPNAEAVAYDGRATQSDFELAYILERVAHFYLRQFNHIIEDGHSSRTEGPYVGLLKYAEHVCNLVESGEHAYAQAEWAYDDYENIREESERYPENIDLKIMHTIGKHMPAVIRGETTILEHLTKDNLLNDYYGEALGISYYTEYLARIVGQLVHRYPHLQILEVGAGTGGATKRIIKNIGRNFSSYTFTDISNGFFENAQQLFKECENKMVFKVLDLEKDIKSQGYTEYSYDVVIASFVLHATTNLDQTLTNVRRLLKPGGFLLMLEVTNLDQARLGFIFGSLPGWWLGADDGRSLSPCVTNAEWDVILHRTGFSGVQSVTPDLDPLPFPASALVSQAVDPRFDFIRNPLSKSSEVFRPGPAIPNFVILGGNTAKTSTISNRVSRLLHDYCTSIFRISSLEHLEADSIPAGATILNLLDLDSPVFKDMTASSLAGIKVLFENSKNILWITQGCRVDNPYQNQSLGFGRSMLVEMPHIRSQFLDIDYPNHSTARLIAEALLRFVVVDNTELPKLIDEILWSTETEFAIEEGVELVPRVILNQQKNDRYNSSRRLITRDIELNDTVVAIAKYDGSYAVLEAPKPVPTLENDLLVKTNFSSFSSVRVSPTTSLFLVHGTVVETGQQVISYSKSNASWVAVQKVAVLPYSHDKAALSLLLYFNYVATLNIFDGLLFGHTLVVQQPDAVTAAVLTYQASRKHVRLAFVTTEPEPLGDKWIYIHERANLRDIKKELPKNIGAFLYVQGSKALAARIESCVLQANKRNSNSLASFTNVDAHSDSVSLPGIQKIIYSLLSYLEDIVGSLSSFKVPVVPINDISSVPVASAKINIVDWNASPKIKVQINPVDRKPLLSREKTYWLVGLTGSLGISLCQWMIVHGAKHVVLTSRSPKIDQRLIDEMELGGAKICVIAGDITNKESLRSVYDEICKTLPPIGGVAQGAMVLRDTMLADMDIDAMNSVLKPKVDGSHNLDELFSENTLDFFVFFSSATCVTGNLGQSNYAVANMFMTGLAANRRKRGLAGSVIDIGAIIGVGYVTRETSQELQDNLVKSGHNWMSEEDFHTIFAEAIIAGNPGNDLSPELVTGLRIINASDAQRPLWADMPRFQHMVTHEDVRVGGDEAFRTVVATRTQLLAAKSQDQVQEILRDAFVNKLHVMLQFDEEGKRATIIDQSTADLGIDSLNAVEIRSWFLKELKVDMPILRILSGATVGELLAFAQEKLPEEFLQGIGSNTDLVNQAVNTSLPQAQSSSSDYVEIPEADSSSDSFSIISSPGQIDDSGQAADLVSSITTSSSDPLSPLKTDVAFQRTEAMSFGQSRFWFLKFYLQEQTTFNITCSIALKGDLRIDDFERAVNTIGQRHEALRTCFFANEEQRPMQGVLSKATLKLERKNFENDQDLDDEMARLKEHIYDIERGQIMRILLLSQKTSNSQYANRHQILIGYHHINMDGISLQIILSELERAYSHQTLNSSVLQYPDFTSRQRRDQSNGTWNEDIAFWKKEFPDFPPDFAPLGLSDVKFRRPLIKYDHHRVDFRVKSTLAPKIKAICRTHKVTPYHFYLAAFEVLLHRFSGATDFCVGVADGNRTETDMSESVGFFLNLLPLRLRIGSDQSFAETLKDARAKAYSAMAHSRLPFDILLNELNVPRAATHNPLFQVFLDYRQGIEEKRSFGNCQLEGQQYETGKTSYDIALDITDNAKGEALLMIAVQKELYSFQAAETLMQSFVNLVEAFTKNPSLQLDEPALFRREEVEKAIVLGRGAIRPAKWPATLSHRVDDMIGSFGDNLALKDGSGNTLTYNKMSQRVNSIALGLMNAGLSTGAKIGVFQNPSSDWICSMLAILRIGAVYVPLDLRLTIPRLAAIVADCLPDGILADSDTIEKVPDLGLPVLSWTINVSLLPSSLGAMIANCATPNSAATILYTSGSTGAPKGTVLKHEGLRNNIEGNTEEFQVGPEDSVLQQISLSFDFSMWQIFMALANGASLYVVPKSLRGDTEAIVKLIADEKITFTGATPSEYTSWLHYGDSSLLRSSAWNMAVSAGEEVTLRLKQDLLSLGKRNLRFFNGYGPTEASLSCSKTEILYFDDKAGDSSADARVSAGFTAPNYAIYIVDEALNPVPVGVPGQILIGGAGVASGYLNNNEMTKERFTTDKHAPLEFLKQGWNRVHLTGDQGRLRDDGALVIEGRISGDTQIKLRGLRIDLQDIETTIIKCSNGMLHEAVVSLRRATNSSPDFLVAHVQFASTYTGERDKYLQELVKRLPVPQYMRPAMMISLDRMPISNHFKLDRKAINNLEFPQSSQRDLASLAIDLTETESHLIDVWESVISKELVSFHEINKGSDFFHVGGNSLLLVNLKSEINKIFGVDLPLVELFQASTLEDMASRVQSGATSENVAMLDWNDETTLPSELFSIPLATSKRPPSAYKTIILTGATGFLGRAILQRLVDDKRVTKIHCVAVRDSPKTVIFNSSKVVIHKGDLGLPRLGLPKSLAASLFQTADAIIHNGADVSFLKTYTTLKPVNVQSTIELVKLSLPYQIPFHYISTTGVGNLLAAMTFEEASVNQARPAADGSDGYVSTKWVSERLLEKIAAQFHQRVLIHRPSSITGEDAPQLDVMHNLLTYSRKIRAVPVSNSWSGYLDFISVEHTAREVCEHTLNVSDKIDRLGEVEYLHHAGELRIELENMKGYMEKETGESFRAVSMGEWANEAEGVGLSGLVGAYLKKVEAEGIKAVFPRIRNERGGGGMRS